MNKYLALTLFALILFGSGWVYQEYYRPENVGGVPSSGRIVDISMRVVKNHWKFEPDTVRAEPGDRVRIHIYNEDSYDHGFAIDILGVNRRLFPERTTTVEFNASLAGTFPFYCSVPCGDGHYDQVGTLIVGEEEHHSSFAPRAIREHPAQCPFFSEYNGLNS
jgi:cytochrome c oxidase subunit II